MDFPKSVPGVGLVDGRFVDEDGQTGQEGSLIPAQWGNLVTDELNNLVKAAGMVPDEGDPTQVRTAVMRLAGQVPILEDQGGANAYAAENSPALTADTLKHGQVQRVSVKVTNSGASTYSPDGLPPLPVYGLAVAALQGDEMKAGHLADLVYFKVPGVNGGNGAWILTRCTGAPVQVATATKGKHAVNLDQADARYANIASNLQPGQIVFFAGGTLPANWLLCPTAQTNLSRAAYPKLWAALGAAWGAGDGATTFGMPWFPPDYAPVQANSNVASRSVGQVLSHDHYTPGSFIVVGGGTGLGSNGAGVLSNPSTSTTGGAANLAAGVRLQLAVVYQ